MNGSTTKKIKQVLRINYDDLIRKLYDESWSIRFKFAYKLIWKKKPFKFIWK